MTVHLVGHNTQKPGLSGARFAFSFSNLTYLLGEYLTSLKVEVGGAFDQH